MTTAPGLTMSAVSTLRLPTARHDHIGLQGRGGFRSGVAAVADGDRGVGLAAASCAMGLPTMLLRPMTTACLPRKLIADASSIFMQP